jgi:hypothetical protein
VTRSLLLLFLVFFFAPACHTGARREAEQLLSAVERFRRADNAAKPATVDALRAVPCSDPEVCRARDACLASAEATAKALRLKSEVEQGLAALEKGQLAKDSPEAQALPTKLDEAASLLDEGHKRLEPCEEQTAALRRKHRI